MSLMFRNRRPKEDPHPTVDLREEDEVIDLRDSALAAWEDSASFVTYDEVALRREAIDRRRDTVAPQAHQ